ncbi:MAG TPA: glycosyltransferase family 2 protein [Clostridiaceae bacterium]|nr:glycosyltransferase family 2 protein [Clostridiaceae bacterium]
MITVFTPTYNRKDELKKLYKSLLNQNFKDFEWLIVDDGSEDGTEEAIKNFINENKININYYKQANQGKSVAHNKGVELAKGEFFVGIDSDDIFMTDALEKIYKYFEVIKDKNEICGICFLNCKKENNQIIGSEFPKNKMIDNYYNIYHKHKVTGDKEMVFKTNILKDYLFPIYENEKFVPEALLFNRICRKYSFLCINEPVIYKEYLDKGYTSNYFNLAKKNPKGQMIYYRELYDLEPTNYNVAAYDMYSIYAKYGFLKTIRNHPAKIKCIFLYIPAYIKYLQKEKKK